MKTVTVYKKHDLADFVRRSALESDINQLVSESCIIVDGDTKEVVALYVQMTEDTTALLKTLEAIEYHKGDRTSGLVSNSRIFGYSPRLALRKDYCSSTSLATEQPKQHNVIIEWGKTVAKYYQDFLPERYKSHNEQLTDKVIDEYRIEGTPFTSGIINKNNPLKYHFDSGNFKGVYSCMITVKHDTAGGNLSMPEYELGFNLSNGSIAMFDGQSILHGVTPIQPMSHDAARFTIVYYSLLQMWKCLPLTEEIARIRQVKSEREARRARVMQGLEDEHPAVLATKRAGERKRSKQS